MNVLKPHLQTTIWTLLKARASQRDIERVTGISRHTIRHCQQLFASQTPAHQAESSDVPAQTAPPWPPTSGLAVSHYEPLRPFIEAHLRLRRIAMAIYQDLVDQYGFSGAYNSGKRFVAKLRIVEPAQFDRLSFQPGEEMQVDYGEGALTRMAGSERYRKPRLFVATLRYSRRSFRRVVWNSSQETWARLHEKAWRYFGGSCPEQATGKSELIATGPGCAHGRPACISWARLLKRVFQIDIEHCPNCGGQLKIIAAILEAPVIERILTHLGLQARAPPRVPTRGDFEQAV